MRSIHNSLTVNLLRVREYFMQYFRPILKQHGVTEQQWRIISYLHEYPDTTIEQMSNIVCISSPSLTGILNRMEGLGWINRRTDARDKRCTYISLTDLGKSLYADVSALSSQAYEALEKDVGLPEIKILEGIIESINNKFQGTKIP